jgi:hypothetical protein
MAKTTRATSSDETIGVFRASRSRLNNRRTFLEAVVFSVCRNLLQICKRCRRRSSADPPGEIPHTCSISCTCARFTDWNYPKAAHASLLAGTEPGKGPLKMQICILNAR